MRYLNNIRNYFGFFNPIPMSTCGTDKQYRFHLTSLSSSAVGVTSIPSSCRRHIRISHCAPNMEVWINMISRIPIRNTSLKGVQFLLPLRDAILSNTKNVITKPSFLVLLGQKGSPMEGSDRLARKRQLLCLCPWKLKNSLHLTTVSARGDNLRYTRDRLGGYGR